MKTLIALIALFIANNSHALGGAATRIGGEVAPIIALSSPSVTGSWSFTNPGNVFVGDGSGLTNLPPASVPNTLTSSMTLTQGLLVNEGFTATAIGNPAVEIINSQSTLLRDLANVFSMEWNGNGSGGTVGRTLHDAPGNPSISYGSRELNDLETSKAFLTWGETRGIVVSTAIISNSTITATAFVGNGSALTNLPVQLESNTFTSSKTFTSGVLIGGLVNGSSATFTNTVEALTVGIASHAIQGSFVYISSGFPAQGNNCSPTLYQEYAGTATVNIPTSQIATITADFTFNAGLAGGPGRDIAWAWFVDGALFQEEINTVAGSFTSMSSSTVISLLGGIHTFALASRDINTNDCTAIYGPTNNISILYSSASIGGETLFLGDGTALTGVVKISGSNMTGLLSGSSATFTNTVTASTFNAVGSAYQMAGITVIDHYGNIGHGQLTPSVLVSSSDFSGDFGAGLNSSLGVVSVTFPTDYATVTATANYTCAPGGVQCLFFLLIDDETPIGVSISRANNSSGVVSFSIRNLPLASPGVHKISVGAYHDGGGAGSVSAGEVAVYSGPTSSPTLILGDGSALTNLPVQLESNTFTSSKTFTSDVLSLGSVTASGFFGNGSGLTGFVVFGSSSSTNTKAIDSTAFVQVTTMSIILRGGRALSGMATIHIENTSGAGRTYTVQVERGGVAVSNQYLNLVSAGDDQTVSFQWAEASSTAGAQVYTISVKSSNGAATQSAKARIITVTEF